MRELGARASCSTSSTKRRWPMACSFTAKRSMLRSVTPGSMDPAAARLRREAGVGLRCRHDTNVRAPMSRFAVGAVSGGRRRQARRHFEPAWVRSRYEQHVRGAVPDQQGVAQCGFACGRARARNARHHLHAFHPGWVRTGLGGAGPDIDAATSVAGMRVCWLPPMPRSMENSSTSTVSSSPGSSPADNDER